MIALAVWMSLAGPVEEPVESPDAAEPTASADELYDEAFVAFEAGVLAGAAALFERAHEAGARVAVLYDWAQVVRLGGDCHAATALYQRFVDEAPEQPPPTDPIDASTWASMRANAAEQIAACPAPVVAAPAQTTETPARPEPVPAPVFVPSVSIDDAASSVSLNDAEARGVDGLGVALLAVGGAIAVTGGGLLIGADVVRREAEDAFVHQTQSDGLRQANALQTAGLVAVPVGLAVAVGGALRLGLVARKNKRRVALTPAPSGVVFVGRF